MLLKLLSDRGFDEAYLIRHMAGLGILKHDSPGIKYLAGNGEHEVVISEIKVLPVLPGGLFSCDASAAGGDIHMKFLLEVSVDGMLCDLFGEPLRLGAQEGIGVIDDRLVIELAHSADEIQFRTDIKAGLEAERFICRDDVEGNQLCLGGNVVSGCRLREAFDSADRKQGFVSLR